MELFTEIITLLENGEWYSFEDLNKYYMAKSQIRNVLKFLFEYNFLEKNYKNDKFRLIPKLVSLVEERNNIDFCNKI